MAHVGAETQSLEEPTGLTLRAAVVPQRRNGFNKVAGEARKLVRGKLFIFADIHQRFDDGAICPDVRVRKCPYLFDLNAPQKLPPIQVSRSPPSSRRLAYQTTQVVPARSGARVAFSADPAAPGDLKAQIVPARDRRGRPGRRRIGIGQTHSQKEKQASGPGARGQ